MLLRDTFKCSIAKLLSAIQTAIIIVSTPEFTSHLSVKEKNPQKHQISFIKIMKNPKLCLKL